MSDEEARPNRKAVEQYGITWGGTGSQREDSRREIRSCDNRRDGVRDREPRRKLCTERGTGWGGGWVLGRRWLLRAARLDLKIVEERK